ncbi:MAG: helix-turn-helix domain-containing protein [Bdellovibrionaceae bacterium]|nr:helix-turn-helix domain-containing protein [Pseudobdellovibrionaceae bacterium]
MNAKKIQIDKSWLEAEPRSKAQVSNFRKLHKFEHMTVTKSEDLPELMTTKDAAEILRKHPDTIKEYRNDGSLKFIKIKGRYYTTPEYIADFIESEMKRKK